MALDVQAARQILEDERKQLLSRSIPLSEPGKGDEADMAALQQAKDRLQWLANDQKQRLAQIDQALARIMSGLYGICDDCGEPIALERMEAIPHAILCIGCQANLERKRK
jgi:DnaK suppressor protein